MHPVDRKNLLITLEEHIFGQKGAVNLLHHALQSIFSPLPFSERKRPLGCFLFVGKHGVGKKKTAQTLAHILFDHACLHIAHHNNPATWLDLQVREHYHYRPLSEVIQKNPNAIILFENIDETFKQGVAFLDEMFSHPDFRQAIIILTTTLGSEQLTPNKPTPSSSIDLMQLVLNDNIPFQHAKEISQTHFHAEIFSELKLFFGEGILRQLQLIPYLPLENSALEKIIRLKLHALRKTIEAQCQIDLHYAPEVILFLLHKVNKSLANYETIDTGIEHALHPCISHAIHTQPTKNAKQLLISLNDSGQLLKSELMANSHEFPA